MKAPGKIKIDLLKRSTLQYTSKELTKLKTRAERNQIFWKE